MFSLHYIHKTSQWIVFIENNLFDLSGRLSMNIMKHLSLIAVNEPINFLQIEVFAMVFMVLN